ncbi:MAG: hypothetical protein R3C08_14945 [Hyphomonas sp.]
MNRWTELSDAAARAAFAGYFAKVDRLLAPLPDREAAEVRRELEQHAMDALAEGATAAEALERLGEPDDFLPDLVAETLRTRAARSFLPGHVARALVTSASTGLAGFVLSSLAGLGYAVAFVALAMGVVRLIDPDAAGVYRMPDGQTLIGFGKSPGDVDLMGAWFAPAAFAVAIGLYLILTLAFGWVKIRKPGGRRDK